MRKPDTLDGKTAVVTGASRGIGAAIVRRLADAGARVALVGRSRETLERTAADLAARVMVIPGDLSTRESAQRAANDVASAIGGAPDILVNNAGAFFLAPADQTPPAEFERAISVNLIAAFVLVHAAVPEMKARGDGHIVTIGSIADRVIYAENAAYAASKFGVRALHEVLRTELRGTGVRTTLVSPGPVDTPLWDAVNPDETEGFTPRAMMLRAEAVADAVFYAVTAPRDVNIDELRLSRA